MDDHGCTAIHVAAFLNHEEVVAILISSGENVNVADNSGRTPLHIVVSNTHCISSSQRRLNIINQLLQAGANVNTQDRYGLTALHYCCDRDSEQVEAVALLLAAGADMNVPRWQPCRLEIGAGRAKYMLLFGVEDHGWCAVDGK